MNNRTKLRLIHQELSDIYRAYRGVNAPVNTRTEAMWREIERLEAEVGA